MKKKNSISANQISVRLPAPIMTWLQKRAAAEYSKLSESIRHIIIERMEAEQAEKPKRERKVAV